MIELFIEASIFEYIKLNTIDDLTARFLIRQHKLSLSRFSVHVQVHIQRW